MSDYHYEKFIEHHYEHCKDCQEREKNTPSFKVFWIEDCPAYKKELEQAESRIDDQAYDSWVDDNLTQ